ncbi:uncharacterized protein ARMOST_04873 [Armillaria ostoyae]|uniref:Uncharacterized protein n=1 Tax=Armillaria ostoyae TaxID=47428 RepID=A0A284QYJ8_ARMOS|nr:uncharacterized protein ARMOST_04873 [Armillaria ostoyae]
MFGTRRRTRDTHHASSTTTRKPRFWHRRDKDRSAGGYKAALTNPNTTHHGRRHAKHELRKMVRYCQILQH